MSSTNAEKNKFPRFENNSGVGPNIYQKGGDRLATERSMVEEASD